MSSVKRRGAMCLTSPIAAGRRYVQEAADAAAALPGAELGRCLADLAHGLLDDLPVVSR